MLRYSKITVCNDKLFFGPTFLHDSVGGCDTDARYFFRFFWQIFWRIFWCFFLTNFLTYNILSILSFLGPTFLHDFVGGCDTNASTNGSPPISGRRRKSICFGHSICNFPTVWLHPFTHTFRACHRFYLSPLEIHMWWRGWGQMPHVRHRGFQIQVSVKNTVVIR